jgi:hypothetical protein
VLTEARRVGMGTLVHYEQSISLGDLLIPAWMGVLMDARKACCRSPSLFVQGPNLKSIPKFDGSS